MTGRECCIQAGGGGLWRGEKGALWVVGSLVTSMRCPNCSDIDSCYFEKWKRVVCAFGSVFGGGLELHAGIVLCLLGGGLVGTVGQRWAGGCVGRKEGVCTQRAPGRVQRGEKIGIIVTHSPH